MIAHPDFLHLAFMRRPNDSQNKPTVNYLERAVKAALKGDKIETAETPTQGHGCGVVLSD
jgi:hypothetical protein